MKKILIIEDDNFLQDLEAEKIKKHDYDVIIAKTGEEAMTKILEPGIDLVILDLLLPNFDGFQILEKIKTDDATKKIPVIIFSNLSKSNDMEKAIKLGANEFMIKSNFSLEELVEHINKMLA